MAGNIAMTITESGVNIPRNTSVVTVNVYYYGNGMSWNANSCPGTIYIDGASYSFSHSFTRSSGAQWLGSASRTVTHNNDGSKTVYCSASFNTDVSLGTLSTSGSATLTVIPRASDLSLSVNEVYADGSSEITAIATKKSSNFTDKLVFKFGNRSIDIESGVPFVIPIDWCNEMPNTEHMDGVIEVTTSNGDTVIGSRTEKLTVKVPLNIVPTIDEFTIKEAVQKVHDAFNIYCEGLSKLDVKSKASAYYGATIKSYNAKVEDTVYDSKEFISNILITNGELPITMTVTDSRGRKATVTKKVTVYPYDPPIIYELKFDQGKALTVMVKGFVDRVRGNNTKTLIIKYKSIEDEDYISRVVPLDEWEFDVSTTINLDTSLTYEVVAELSDKITSAVSSAVTGIPVISRLAGGKGVTIGAEAEREGFVLSDGWDFLIEDDELEQRFVEAFGSSIKA